MKLEKYSKQALKCALCLKMCKFVCPVAGIVRREPVYPPNKALMVHFMASGIVDINEEGDVLAKYLYLCTMCGLCSTEPWCGLKISMPEIVESARTYLVSLNKVPENVLEVEKSARENHNPYGEPSAQRFSHVNAKFSDNADVAYFVGCTSAYRRPEIANATINLLKTLNIDFTLIKEEQCCGSPLLRLGFLETAKEFAQHNVSVIESIGVSKVVFTCPGCYRSFKKDYPEMGVDVPFEIYHISEFLIEQIDKKDLTQMNYRTLITYHDPCHLGRHLGIFDPPRKLLEKIGYKIKEMSWNKESSKCCGAGGGLLHINKEVSKEVARKRLEEAVGTKAKILVTSCPFCKTQFDNIANGKILVKDITELLFEALNSLPVQK